MKTKLKLVATSFTLGLLLTVNLQPSSFAQGTLAPPGPPAPGMKSLDQIEARTPISSLPFTISTSGSYYVTANLTAGVNQSGIIIAADNVTVDLNSFTLSGAGGSVGEGVDTSGARANVVVRNGTVRNWPGSGINFYDSGASQTLVQNVHSISNVFTGIAVKNGSHVEDCTTLGNGIRGIIVDNDSLVEHCKASANVSVGIAAGSNCQLLDNQSTANGTGLIISGTGNIVGGNIVHLNTANYSITQGNQLDLLLCQIPETINWPAKVKLVGSLSVTSGNAITINANNVTLDLNGFTLSSTENPAGSGCGIMINGSGQNVTIVNGFIQGGVSNNGSGVYSGSGFGYGIYDTNSLSANVRIRDVSISGCQYDGVYLPFNSTVVESCAVHTVGAIGIAADIVKNSSATDCGNAAINGDEVADCRGQTSANSYGILADTILNCYGYSSVGGVGIFGSTTENSYGYSYSGTGVNTGTALNCYGYSSYGTGINAATALNCYGYSNGSGDGVYSVNIANGCYGYSYSAAGVSAFIASVCHGDSTTGTPLSTSHNINSY